MKIFHNILLSLIITLSYCCSLVANNRYSVTKELAVLAVKHQSLSSWNDENESKNIDTTKVSMISPAGKANLFLVHENDKYYVVSSDLRAVPILVECANKPDWNDIPPAALELYSYYEDVMSFLHNSSDSIDVVNEDWNRIINRQPLLTRTSGAVAPLLGEKTLENKWNQSFSNASVNDCDKYYNKLCPTWYNADGHCGHTYVGCGAVAMAQVMWYYKFPYAAMVPDTISKNGKPSNNMRLSEYDWSIMPANVTNTTPIPHVNMIAKLMRDCGFRLKTKYKSNESTSDQFYLDNALMFFGYSHTMQHYSKILTSGWTNKVIRELQEGRPVIYNGGVDSFYSNGHIFVVDGYNLVAIPEAYISASSSSTKYVQFSTMWYKATAPNSPSYIETQIATTSSRFDTSASNTYASFR